MTWVTRVDYSVELCSDCLYSLPIFLAYLVWVVFSSLSTWLIVLSCMVVNAIVCVFYLPILKHESGRYTCLSLVSFQQAIHGNSLNRNCFLLVVWSASYAWRHLRLMKWPFLSKCRMHHLSSLPSHVILRVIYIALDKTSWVCVFISLLLSRIVFHHRGRACVLLNPRLNWGLLLG